MVEGARLACLPLYQLQRMESSGTLSLLLQCAIAAQRDSVEPPFAQQPQQHNRATFFAHGVGLPASALAEEQAGFVFLLPVRNLRAAVDAGLLPRELTQLQTPPTAIAADGVTAPGVPPVVVPRASQRGGTGRPPIAPSSRGGGVSSGIMPSTPPSAATHVQGGALLSQPTIVSANVGVVLATASPHLALPPLHDLALPLISVAPILITQGINEMHSASSMVGGTGLQYDVNLSASHALGVYTAALDAHASQVAHHFHAAKKRLASLVTSAPAPSPSTVTPSTAAAAAGAARGAAAHAAPAVCSPSGNGAADPWGIFSFPAAFVTPNLRSPTTAAAASSCSPADADVDAPWSTSPAASRADTSASSGGVNSPTAGSLTRRAKSVGRTIWEAFCERVSKRKIINAAHGAGADGD
ncbi:hypothetical protein EON68_03270, partial [archaeon]